MSITTPKGTHDILPKDIFMWQYVEDNIRQVSKLFNCLEIRTPIFEHTELFLRGIGDGTDIVSKEMYTFFDKSNPPTSLTLKPEGTAPVVRSYVENSLNQIHGLPLKLFYLSPIFRYEKPQKGRFRQHHQYGVEMYGSSSPYMDFETISLAYFLLSKFGINLRLQINTVGCEKCRPAYTKALSDFINKEKDIFCATCNERRIKNVLRVLDCKEKKCKEKLNNAPKIIDYVCEDCKNHHVKLLDLLKKNSIEYTQNHNIVRGLDYYNKTVFEFVALGKDEGQLGTVCGGGRYDNLVKELGGDIVPCVGFGMGLERLITLMKDSNLSFGKEHTVDVFLMHADDLAYEFLISLANTLRQNNISVEFDSMGKSLKAQFKHADRIKAKFCIVIGENEIKSGKGKIRDLTNGNESDIIFVDVLSSINKLL